MGFQVSPGVLVREFDVQTGVPSLATTTGALAGVFHWGPVEKRALIGSEIDLVSRFGKPSNFNPETWFTAASFLSYGDSLIISRALDTTGNNFTKSYTGNTTNLVAESGNNILTLANSTVGNTTGIAVGMKILFSNTTAIPEGALVTSVNSTAVVIDNSVSANVEAAQIVFRENIGYSAVALQSDLGFDETDVTDWDSHNVKNDDHYSALDANGQSFDSAVLYIARYPGEYGNSLRVSVCDSDAQFKSNTSLAPNAQFDTTTTTACALTGIVGSNTLTLTVSPANTANVTQVATINAFAADVLTSLSVGDLIEVGNTRINFQSLKVTSLGSLTNTSNVFSFNITCDDELKLSTNSVNQHVARFWEYYNVVDVAPGQSDYVANFGNTNANDELHIIVSDELGKFSGSPGTVLEVYKNVSRATDAKTDNGTTNYYKSIINQQSRYLWWANDRTTAVSNTAEFVVSSSATAPLSSAMVGGNDGLNEAEVSIGTLAFAYDLFADGEDVDVNLVMQGKARGESVSHYTQLGNYILDNICENRKDCVGFISPDYNDVVYNPFEEANDIVDFRNSLRVSSYGVLDTGYKYMYDKYNDTYRWVPLNGDIAGLCARTDMTNDPWWSPAGLTRGQIKNSIRLAYNPSKKSDRNLLYKNNVNPVLSEKGNGTYLNGDKTLLSKESPFNRINVRRLFITVEKSIATAAKYTLFEFNDDFTRAQFRNLINPYLRDVKGRRGIIAFEVKCDGENNPGIVIDRNEFIGSIFIKPARSINFITLNFVAVGTDVSFSEIIGKAF